MRQIWVKLLILRDEHGSCSVRFRFQMVRCRGRGSSFAVLMEEPEPSVGTGFVSLFLWAANPVQLYPRNCSVRRLPEKYR